MPPAADKRTTTFWTTSTPPVTLIKTDGTESGAYTYDPYGTYTDNNISGGSATGENPFRYAATGTYDHATGYIKYGNRYYNPTTGRFTQPDTITTLADPGNANQYAYASDNPINNIDPTGRFSIGDIEHYLNDFAGFAVGVVVGVGCEIVTVVGSFGCAIIGGALGIGTTELLDEISGT